MLDTCMPGPSLSIPAPLDKAEKLGSGTVAPLLKGLLLQGSRLNSAGYLAGLSIPFFCESALIAS